MEMLSEAQNTFCITFVKTFVDQLILRDEQEVEAGDGGSGGFSRGTCDCANVDKPNWILCVRYVVHNIHVVHRTIVLVRFVSSNIGDALRLDHSRDRGAINRRERVSREITSIPVICIFCFISVSKSIAMNYEDARRRTIRTQADPFPSVSVILCPRSARHFTLALIVSD
jgi:hypothetical protein